MPEIVITESLPEAVAPVADGDEEIQWLLDRLNANDAMYRRILEAIERTETLITSRLLSLLETQQVTMTAQQTQLTELATRLSLTSSNPPPPITVVTVPEPIPEPIPEPVLAESAVQTEPEKRIPKRRKL
jgi:hypothetical protein